MPSQAIALPPPVQHPAHRRRGDFQHRQVGEAIPPPAASAGTPRDLFVQAVAPDGAAAAAGIQAGDVITKADGADATSSLPLQALSLTKSPGDAVGIEHWRDGHTATATVTPGSASQT